MGIGGFSGSSTGGVGYDAGVVSRRTGWILTSAVLVVDGEPTSDGASSGGIKALGGGKKPGYGAL